MTGAEDTEPRLANHRTWLVLRMRSFRYAFRGVWVARTGSNFRVQLAGACAAGILVVAFGVSRTHLGLVILAIVAVLSAELLNSAIERICDLVGGLHGLGWDSRIRDIKDLAAAAVLVVCAGAAAIGVVVFVRA
jgi:diacylglycerol kinase (ATP)